MFNLRVIREGEGDKDSNWALGPSGFPKGAHGTHNWGWRVTLGPRSEE